MYVLCAHCRNSSVGIATRCGAGRSCDRIPVVGKNFQTDPEAHQFTIERVTDLSPGPKRPGRDADHPPTSIAEAEEKIELHLNSPSGHSWPVLGRPYIYIYIYIYIFFVPNPLDLTTLLLNS